MPDIVIPINKTVDISKGTLYTTLGLQNTHDQLIQGQSYANVLNVSVYDGAEPIALSGACMGYFVRQQDGSTVTVAGTISGNVASVEFPSFVYDYTGLLTITLNVGGTSLVQIATTVRLGATMVVVDPGNVLPNLDEIQQIMLDVENALNQLSGALEASQAATQAANTAAGTANTAAQGANEAASAANTAASALNGLTATANTLEPDEPATAVAELVSGAWKITFGIPQGVQGIQGVRGTVAWHGTAITGTSTTPTAYPTGIDSAIAGDLYLYSGTDVANIGNVYTCTQGGDASTALWAYMANWRGATGAGSVSSVNSVLPNTDGDVELTAADVGARPNTWMPTAEDVGARPNTWMPSAEDVGALPNDGTADNSSKLGGKTLSEIMLEIYPVGSIYLSTVSANPGTLFGGSWEAINNVFLLAAGPKYAAGSTGGEENVTLTTDQMPAHSHDFIRSGTSTPTGKMTLGISGEYGGGNYGGFTETIKALASAVVNIENTGGGLHHNNMPPYLAVYTWKRVA